MMEVMGWLRWQWRKWEHWQKVWIVGFFFFGAGINAEQPFKTVLWAIPASIFFFYLGKWWIWEPVKESYAAYQKEKQELFKTIKTSDQK